MNAEDMVIELQEKADEVESVGAIDFPDDPNMIVTYRNDANELRKAATMIEDEEYDEALEHLEMLDTALRDEVPDNVWTFLEEQND